MRRRCTRNSAWFCILRFVPELRHTAVQQQTIQCLTEFAITMMCTLTERMLPQPTTFACHCTAQMNFLLSLCAFFYSFSFGVKFRQDFFSTYSAGTSSTRSFVFVVCQIFVYVHVAFTFYAFIVWFSVSQYCCYSIFWTPLAETVACCLPLLPMFVHMSLPPFDKYYENELTISMYVPFVSFHAM